MRLLHLPWTLRSQLIRAGRRILEDRPHGVGEAVPAGGWRDALEGGAAVLDAERYG
jgi:hypothetical protein